MITWTLKSGHDRRLRAQHPWVFSNELSASPKGTPPGASIILRDHRGDFLATGYGNPASLIAFRALSFTQSSEDPCQASFILERLKDSWKERHQLGFHRSFRLCFGEADFLPGLVIDRYLVKNGDELAQVFSFQILTAGMAKIMAEPTWVFEELAKWTVSENLSPVTWQNTAVVLRTDVQIRKLEGLECFEPKQIKSCEGLDIRHAGILVDGVLDNQDVMMNCDLLEGQKTGFFLDQLQNIRFVSQAIAKAQFSQERPVRILDLCCYVGHWGSQLTRVLKQKGYPVEVTVVDVSDAALDFAEANAKRQGASVICKKMDVLEGMGAFPNGDYDIVIADPPAFIKAKKDIPTGRHAYLKMNSQAFRVARHQGFVVSCSCSGLFLESEFEAVIAKAIRRNSVVANCILRGGPSADHPHRLSFPEGAYLKMFCHFVRQDGSAARGSVLDLNAD